MNKKARKRPKPEVSRLEIGPEDSEVPHMLKGKFITPEKASSTKKDENPLVRESIIFNVMLTVIY